MQNVTQQAQNKKGIHLLKPLILLFVTPERLELSTR